MSDWKNAASDDEDVDKQVEQWGEDLMVRFSCFSSKKIPPTFCSEQIDSEKDVVNASLFVLLLFVFHLSFFLSFLSFFFVF